MSEEPRFTEKEVISSVLHVLFDSKKAEIGTKPGFTSLDPDKVENHVINVIAAALRKLSKR